MYGRSERFDNAIRFGGASPISVIDAYRAGVRVASNLPWTKPSSVTVDETASTWRTCEVTFVDVDHDLIPTSPTMALAPYGTDLFIRTGFRYGDGTTELLPMGVFRILVSRPTAKGLISVLGYDYSRVVARARFEVPRVFPRGYSRAQAIAELIGERTESVSAGHDVLSYEVSDDSLLPLTIFEEGERYGDPWKACTDLAESAGQQVFFMPVGPWPTAVLRNAPDIAEAFPVWHFQRGEGSTLVEMQPEQDTTTGYNVYVVTGEGSELASGGAQPVRGSAEVTDPASPIYPGTYGRVPTFLASSFIKTDAQAEQVANANLPRKAGGSEGLTIKGFAHPGHEAGDVVRVTDERLGINSNWVVSRFTIDLSLSDYTDYSCRARRVA